LRSRASYCGCLLFDDAAGIFETQNASGRRHFMIIVEFMISGFRPEQPHRSSKKLTSVEDPWPENRKAAPTSQNS